MFLPGIVPIITPQPKQELDPMPTLDPMPDIASSSGLDPMPQLDPMPDISPNTDVSTSVESGGITEKPKFGSKFIKSMEDWGEQALVPAVNEIFNSKQKQPDMSPEQRKALSLTGAYKPSPDLLAAQKAAYAAVMFPAASFMGVTNEIPIVGDAINKFFEGGADITSRLASRAGDKQGINDSIYSALKYALMSKDKIPQEELVQKLTGYTPEQQQNTSGGYTANKLTELGVNLPAMLLFGKAMHGKTKLPKQSEPLSENYNKPITVDTIPSSPLDMPPEVPEKLTAMTQKLDPSMVPPEVKNTVDMEPFYRIIDNILEQEANRTLKDAVKQIEPQPVLDPMPNLTPDLAIEANNKPMMGELNDLRDVPSSLTPKLELPPIEPNTTERGFQLVPEASVTTRTLKTPSDSMFADWFPKGDVAGMGGISWREITNAYEGVKGFIENNKSKVEDLGYALLKRGSAVKAAADPIHILNSTLNNAPGQARQLFNVNLRETGENVKYASPLNIAELANTRPESVREFMRAASNDESLRRRYDMGQDVLWTDSKGTQHTIPYSPELQQATKLMSDNWNEVRNLSEQTGIVGSALRQLSYDPRAEAAYALGKLPLAELEALKKQGLHPDIEAIVDGLINDDPFFDSMNQSKQLSVGGSGRDTDGFKARTGAWGPDVPKEQVFAMRQMQLHRVGAYAQAAQALRKAGVTSFEHRPGMVEIKIDSQSSLARLFEKQLKGSDLGVFQLPDGQWGIKKLPLGDMISEGGVYKTKEAAQAVIEAVEDCADKYIDRGTLMELNDTFGGGREGIQKLSRASDVAGKWYGKLGYSLFKTGMTAWNIKTMLNNGIWTSNMIFTKLGAKGLSPARLKEVYDVLKNPNDVRQAAFQRSGASHSYNVELSQGSKVPDVTEAFKNNDPSAMSKGQKAWTITKEVIKKPGDAYGYIDTHGKANIFLHELESKYDMRSNEMIRKSDGKRITGPDKFDDVDIANFREAGKEANWWLIDYTRQSRALKAYRSLPGGAPFATFYVDMLPKIPQLMAGYGPKGFNAAQLARFWVLPATMILLNEYSKGKLNLSDADEARLRDALPEGQKAAGIGNMVSTNPAVNKYVNPLLSGPLLPTTGKNNMPMYMPTQGFLPFAAPMQTKGIITQLPAFMAPFQDPISTAVGMAAHNREPYSKKDVVADPGNDPEASNKLIDKLIEKNVPYVAGIKRYQKAKAGISPNPYSPPEDPGVVTAAVLSPFRGKEIDEGRSASYVKSQYNKMAQVAKKEYIEAVKNIVLLNPDNPQEAQRLIAIETQNYNKRFSNFMTRTYPNQIRQMTGGK